MCLKISKIFKSKKKKFATVSKVGFYLHKKERDFIHTALHTLTDISGRLHVKLITGVAFGEGAGDMRAT